MATKNQDLKLPGFIIFYCPSTIFSLLKSLVTKKMNAPENNKLDKLVIKNKIVIFEDCAIMADIHIDRFIIGIAANAGFVKFNNDARIDKVMKTAINGPR